MRGSTRKKFQTMRGLASVMERGPQTGTCPVTGRNVDNRGTL